MLSTFGEAIPYLFPGLKNVFLTNTVQAILFDGVTMDCSSDEFTLRKNFNIINLKVHSEVHPTLQKAMM